MRQLKGEEAPTIAPDSSGSAICTEASAPCGFGPPPSDASGSNLAEVFAECREPKEATLQEVAKNCPPEPSEPAREAASVAANAAPEPAALSASAEPGARALEVPERSAEASPGRVGGIGIDQNMSGQTCLAGPRREAGWLMLQCNRPTDFLVSMGIAAMGSPATEKPLPGPPPPAPPAPAPAEPGTSGWMQNLRGSHEDDDFAAVPCSDDPMVFAKPKVQVQAECVERRECECRASIGGRLRAGRAGLLARGLGKGAWDEQKRGQKNSSHSRMHGSEAQESGGYPEPAPVKLPPLDGGSGRGRRAMSQPPVDLPGAQEPKKPRPKSQPPGDEECSRQMFDKNTLRTMHRDLFMGAIQQFRERQVAREVPAAPSSSSVKVCLRKRPIFAAETRADFDAVSVLPGSSPGQVTVHNCLFQADLKTPFVQHLSFDFDEVFDDQVNSEEVYSKVAYNLVERTRDGGVGTMFMFGQTGSGKTHTMTAIQELASQDLFHGENGVSWLSVTFLELRGHRCFDLLAHSAAGAGRKDSRPELRLREQLDGSYGAEGAVTLFPNSPEELCAVMQMAQSRRATSATDANAVSSRSHAVCILRLLQCEGQLMLVDCAGTERRKDSMYHSKERQQEGAEINASLHALKECIRHFATQQRVPGHAYRASSLTKVLAEAFRGKETSLAVVCTASPCATDTEHTISTLRMGAALAGRSEHEQKQGVELQKKRRVAHPKQWTPEQVSEWLCGLNGGQFRDAAEALPSSCTGQMLVRLTENRCVQLCSGNERKGRRLFDLLHQTIDELAMETKRTALLDRLESQLKATHVSRLLFAFNATEDRKVQRAIDQDFADWRKKQENKEALTGLLVYTQSYALHLLEGPTELVFKALGFFQSLSAEVRKAPEVQAGTTPRPNEKGELPALLSLVRVLHFTELHSVRVVRSWSSMSHPGRATSNQMPMEEANCHELVFSCYKKLLCLCLKVQKLLDTEQEPDAATLQKSYKKASEELPSMDEVLAIVGKSSTEFFFTFPEFAKVFIAPFQLVLHSELLWPMPPALSY
ncbi:unnamed protein product [Effrenium voratum]|nr:unnamed protein product [Effrenium voratum]